MGDGRGGFHPFPSVSLSPLQEADRKEGKICEGWDGFMANVPAAKGAGDQVRRTGEGVCRDCQSHDRRLCEAGFGFAAGAVRGSRAVFYLKARADPLKKA